MMKYLISTTSLILLLFWPIQAQETSNPAEPIPPTDFALRVPERRSTESETNYLNGLALRGFSLESQGVLIESLDAHTVYAELNSGVSFNPASVIKVATSFTAHAKFGPEYHFGTTVYADGEINKNSHTLRGNLDLQATGDPLLSAADVSRLVRQIVQAGI